jgi:hypothetical protein
MQHKSIRIGLLCHWPLQLRTESLERSNPGFFRFRTNMRKGKPTKCHYKKRDVPNSIVPSWDRRALRSSFAPASCGFWGSRRRGFETWNSGRLFGCSASEVWAPPKFGPTRLRRDATRCPFFRESLICRHPQRHYYYSEGDWRRRVGWRMKSWRSDRTGPSSGRSEPCTTWGQSGI